MTRRPRAVRRQPATGWPGTAKRSRGSPRAGALATVAALAWALVPVPAPAVAQESPAPAPPPERVFAVGGPDVLSDAALREVQARTGRVPVRLSGPERFSTAVAVSRHAHPDGAGVVYLVNGRRLADAAAAATAVADRRAALLPVEADAMPEVVAAELARLQPRRVFAVGGPSALSQAVLDRAAAVTGRPVTRVTGPDRLATAAALSRHSHPDGTATVYIASAWELAAAVAAVPALDVNQAALLLADRAGLPDVAAEELARLAPERVFVLGGRAALADAVLDQIEAITGVRPVRIAGADRVATAAAISAHAHPGGAATVYVAPAHGLADAIAAAPAVVAHDGALLLAENPELRWTPRLDEARRFAESRAGSVSFAAIGTDGVLAGHRVETTVPAASVLKVMFMAAYLRQPDVAGRALTSSDRALLEPMIRRSANEPATRIANLLGPEPMRRLAAEAGMRDFSYTRPWGLSRTSARDQVRFMLALERLLPARHRDEALRLLTEIVPEQRWGIGQVPAPGWAAHFKGGWGSGNGAVDHQVVLLRHRDGARVSLAVMTTSSPSHEYGKATLQGVFARLLADLPRG